MAFTLDVFKAQLDNLLAADNSELALLARYRCIKAALERYSIDAPDSYSEDEAGDGGKYYELTGASAKLAQWIEGFSRVTGIQYPAPTIASDESPTYLIPEDWDDAYWAGGVRYLYLPHHAPAATETMRITFTVPFSWSVSATTSAIAQTAHGFILDDYVYLDGSTWYKATDSRIATHRVSAVASVDACTAKLLQASPPDRDFFALCYLAAALCCQAIAAKYSRTSDSVIAADSVNHPSRATEFANRAREFEKLYRQQIGLDKDAAVGASSQFVDWDTAPGWPSSRRYVFHAGR